MASSATAKKALAIFFLVFGGALAIFIITQGINIYQSSSAFVSDKSTPSVECIKYFYNVEEINYNQGELSFRIRNLDYSEDIQNITVNGRNLPVTLIRGSSQQIRLGASQSHNFTVYPGECSVYSTLCFIDSKECIRIN